MKSWCGGPSCGSPAAVVLVRVQNPFDALCLSHLRQRADRLGSRYLRFETPEQEVGKFRRRLHRLGAAEWARDAEIVEPFCGRRNGLRALHELGFTSVEGADLSPSLVTLYDGPGTVVVGDCRQLPYPDGSRDVLIVQGGLHHLPRLPEDLDQTLGDARESYARAVASLR